MFNYCHFRNCGGVWDRQEGQFDFSQGLEFNRTGTSADIIAGVEWVTLEQILQARIEPSSMSLGTPRLNRAMNRACNAVGGRVVLAEMRS
jgi:hypothetical protein